MVTGLSNLHKMTISVLKMNIRRIPPKLFTCRGFKKIDNEMFMGLFEITAI